MKVFAAPLIGHNPIAFGCPLSGQAPIVFDVAGALAARGHVLLAAREGKPIPEDGHWMHRVGPPLMRNTPSKAP